MNWDLDTVLLLLLLRIILGLAVLPGSESGAPGGVARPNCPARQCETCTVRKCVASLRFSEKNRMMLDEPCVLYSAIWNEKTASEMQEILQISQTATGCSRMPLTGLNAQFCECRLKCSKAICTWIGLGLDRLEISEASLLRPPAWLLRSQHADSFKSWQN